MWRRWGTPQNFLLAFTDELSKTQKSEFWKNEKASGDVIILNLCNKKHNQMMCAYSDMECDR